MRVLIAYEDPWLLLEKPDGDQLYFPIYCVRLLKPASHK